MSGFFKRLSCLLLGHRWRQWMKDQEVRHWCGRCRRVERFALLPDLEDDPIVQTYSYRWERVA